MEKYKQSKKDRKDESRAMKGSGSFVTGNDESIGRSDHAGMPKDVRMEDYPKASHYRGGMIDDSVNEIDGSMSQASSETNRHLSDQH